MLQNIHRHRRKLKAQLFIDSGNASKVFDEKLKNDSRHKNGSDTVGEIEEEEHHRTEVKSASIPSLYISRFTRYRVSVTMNVVRLQDA